MSDTPDNPILVYLRRLDWKMDRLSDDAADLKRRMTSLEAKVVPLHCGFAAQSERINHIETHLGRVERRLDLVGAVG